MVRTLAKCGVRANLKCVADMSSALAAIETRLFDVAFLDDRLTGESEFERNAAALRAAGFGGEIVFFSNNAPGGEETSSRIAIKGEATPAVIGGILKSVGDKIADQLAA